MQSASKNLVPVTLELGGKSPVGIGPILPIMTYADIAIKCRCCIKK